MYNSEEERYGNYMRMDFGGYNSLMSSLQSVSSALSCCDDVELLQSLGQLSSDLAIAQEDFLATIPLPQLIAVLIDCLHKEHMPDIPIYAMNSLVSIVDSLPHASAIIVSTGGISVLASKLLNFDFIDLAEHSIKVLEKISMEHAMAIVKEGAFDGMINTMDFYETTVQKRILNIAVNIGKNLNSREALDKVFSSLVVFVRLLEFRGNENLAQNEKCLDFLIAVTGNITRIVSKPEEISTYFLRLRDLELVRHIIDLIPNAQSLMVKSIRLMKHLNKNSEKLCSEFLSMGGSDVIKNILKTPLENSNLVTEVLRLTSAIIPAVDSENVLDQKKINLFKEHPQYLKNITQMILPRSVDMYEELVSSESKVVVVEILEKIIRMSPAEELSPYVSVQSFSAFISEILCSKEYKMIENGLKIVNSLYEKCMESVNTNFIREGVLHRVSILKDPAVLKALKPPKDPAPDFPPVLRKFFSHSDMENSERQIFEELMMRIRNRGLDSSNDVLPPLFSMNSQEVKQDYQQNLLGLTKAFLDKHKTIDNKEALQPCKELLKIVKKIESNNGESAYESLIKLQNGLATSKRYSFYEVFNSKLVECLLKWLTSLKLKNSDLLLKRLTEFLSIFLKESPSGESYLSILISLILGSMQYTQNFSIHISNSYAPRKSMQKYRVQFVYTPDSDIENFEELLPKHNLFSAHGHFTISTGQYTSFDTIKSAILSAKNVRDISNLRDFFKSAAERRIRMEYLGEYSGDEEFDEFADDKSQMFLRNENPKISIVLSINGVEIPKGMTMFEAISDSKNSDCEVIKFKLVLLKDERISSETLQHPSQIYSYLINESSKVGLEAKSKALPYLTLLKLLYSVNEVLPVVLPQLLYSPCVPKLSPLVFKSSKLSSLLIRQIQEQNLFLQSIHPRMITETIPMSSSIPIWIRSLPSSCKFLFPYSVRESYLYSFIIRTPLGKQKIRTQRHRLLENAMNIMRDTALLKQGCLEIDYEDEVGTGIGPSLEFFSLTSKEIRKLNFWRNTDDSLLFPCPVQAASSEWKDYFNFFGRFVAKALIDKRQIDLPLSPVFWKLVLNQPINLADMLKVDKSLGQTLIEFQELLLKYKLRKSKPMYKGTNLENLSLFFTLPGYDSIELKAQGKNCSLTIDNIEEYVSLVTRFTLLQTCQALAFRQGLEALIPLSTFEVFNGEEIEDLLCGQSGLQWKLEELQEHINPAHGYTANSSVFHNLLITMSLFDLNEQRKFLMFITGSPRLPVGGFATLNPKLTVVRKEPSMPGMHPDEYLPSVMTCQNYLKLPEYSTLEILQRNLKYAINEGHESFHLS